VISKVSEFQQRPQQIMIVEVRRKPETWAVRSGNQIKKAFVGEGARARAESWARAYYGTFDLVEKPPPKKKRKDLS
jgi:hypothetical protein